MKKIISTILILSLLFSLFACSSQGKIIKGDPEQGESVVIYTKPGDIYEGLFLKIDNDQIVYIDKDTHKAEKISTGLIDYIKISNTHYDFEGIEIKESEINQERSYSRTIGYGVGGFVLGTAAGFGIGLILQSSSSIAPIYPMAILALGGAYVFGDMGNDSDKDVAKEEIRNKRFAKSKVKLEKELEATKKMIEEKKKEKERLEKEMKKNKSQKKDN